jgi:ATP-dependent Lon protease
MSREILENIIENYCKNESGVRELRRCLIQIAQKINMLRMFNTKDLPFHIPDFQLPFVLKKEYIKLFLNKREAKDLPPIGMYT